MTTGAELSTAKLTVALDVRDPFSYLALGPAIELGRELGVEINWLPFRGPSLNPPSAPGVADDRGIRHRRHRAHMIAREIAVYAQAQGLTLKEPYRDAPADAGNLAWLWMRAHATERLETFLAETFRQYWGLELDASDPDAVAKIVHSCGADGQRFLQWASAEGAAALECVVTELAEAGVYSTPAYLTRDEVFLGRQHLPMIRWLLECQKGPVPI
jgi:2-hydroxychromene-2-carboxylate isomerase